MLVTALTLTGCGRQMASSPSADADPLATIPDRESIAVRADYVTASVDAAGGLSAWMKCTALTGESVVTIYESDGSFYLTEHAFRVYPWSDAVRVVAREPRGRFVWLIVGEQYTRVEGEPGLDVSGLQISSREYAEAVLQIVTAPARLFERGVKITRKPRSVRIRGQRYILMQARYPSRQVVFESDGEETSVTIEPYWTEGVYYQNQQSFLVDMIWLANPAKQRYLLARGYDYTPMTEEGALIPTKVEIFESNPDAAIGPRVAQIDLRW
jgi:hypothetical protein